MELTQTNLLENWFTNFSNGFILDPFDDNQFLTNPQNNLPTDSIFSYPFYPSTLDTVQKSVSTTSYDPTQQLMGEGQYGLFGSDPQCFKEIPEMSNVGIGLVGNQNVFESRISLDGSNTIKNVKRSVGAPSKNLMAERRRRKRVNDRLLMLRSIVPKISKMDRTAILGDTIDYIKELVGKIQQLQEEDCTQVVAKKAKLACNHEDTKAKNLTRNPLTFDIEKKENDTRVEIRCALKPGLMLSTISTMEALGLDIEQCVISCFSDFSLQASCSEDADQDMKINSEDIKLALCENAGYGHKWT